MTSFGPVDVTSEEVKRLRSDLVPEHGARERFLMGTNVNTPYFQVPTQKFGQVARARVQGLDLRLRSHLVPEH